MELSSGYSPWKYDKKVVRERADDVVDAVQELRGALAFDCVVLSGTSGVWLGGILQAHAAWPDELAIVLCRKDGEGSHGPLVEGGRRHGHNRAVLVDDFVSSGTTARRVLGTLADQAEIELVGVIQHHYICQHWLPLRRACTVPGTDIPTFYRF